MDAAAYVTSRWRVGSKVGRTIYADLSGLDRDDHPLIGVMDTPALAAEAVRTHNYALAKKVLGR